MRYCVIFFLAFPGSILGQQVLDHNNQPLIYWAQINNVSALTVEFVDEPESDNSRFQETIYEKLSFNSEKNRPGEYTSFRTIVDTSQFAILDSIEQVLTPDTTFIDPEGLTVKIYTTHQGMYRKVYLYNENGVKIFEKIHPSGLKPIYLHYIENQIKLNEEGNFTYHLTFRIFGRNDWEFHFDTLKYEARNYSHDSIFIHSWAKETSGWYYDDPSAETTVKINEKRVTIVYPDTSILNDLELSHLPFKSYFGKEDLSSLQRIIHQNCVEYLDPITGKRAYSSPPFSRHKEFDNKPGYQETILLKDGYRLKNYLITDSSMVLAEVIELDSRKRVTTYYTHRLSQLKPFSTWTKYSYDYLDRYPLLITHFEQTNKPINKPEKHWFKKGRTINIYEEWLSNSLEFIDDSHIKLTIKNNPYIVNVQSN